MTRRFDIKTVPIGGGAPVTVQSMTNTRTADFDATLSQVNRLYRAGADIVRVTLNERGAVESFRRLCAESPVPIVADIHFDYRLALAAVEAGAAKVRVNPGNLQGEDHVKAVAEACVAKGIGVRIGVNAGSLPTDATGDTLAEKMVTVALDEARQFEKYGLKDICLSVKSSNAKTTFDAYMALHDRADYPLHLGVTEAGAGESALAKSYSAIGGLLLSGVGDTIRVSLTADPVEEVKAGVELLRAVGLRRDFVNVISCPTCGRTEFDVVAVAAQVRDLTKDIRKPLTVAVMGCVVNGLGEGKEADLGIAGGRERSVLFVKGEKVGTVDNADVLVTLRRYIEEMTNG
ncbi:MAG: flavodoxin-dependent (E)-4-hydroxy-3-methylbut-2-enyl-diphosphate synthase [Clostridia bacterium]|nr:flavodoxin-dependent (E)-4-hydroxy-3-methylbut-2-enyl-diphosphate synthase [Clostridia bacterium]